MDKEAGHLLRCAAQAMSLEDYDESTKATSSENDRAWLQSSFGAMFGGYDRIVKRLKECVAILSIALEDKSIKMEDIQETFSELSELCEDINIACDLHKIGGFPVILKYLNHKQLAVKFCALDVIVAVSQNNEYCQNALLGFEIIVKLLQLMCLSKPIGDNAEDKANLNQKCLHAVSCIIRQNQKGLEQFLSLNGVEYIMNSLLSTTYKLRLRAAFLLRSLCYENVDCIKSIDDPQVLVDLLQNFEFPDLIECILETIVTLALNHKSFLLKCQNHALNLKQTLNALINDRSICEERIEIVQLSSKLLTIL